VAGLITRGDVYYAVYYVGKKQKRVSLETSSLQLAKDKLRQLESSLYRGNDNPLPTKTPIDKVLTKYIKDMQARKTAKSVCRWPKMPPPARRSVLLQAYFEGFCDWSV